MHDSPNPQPGHLDDIEDELAPSPPATSPERPDGPRRFNLRGRSLREHAARGTLINTAFMVGLSVLNLARGLLLAGFLTREDYGVWGTLAISSAP